MDIKDIPESFCKNFEDMIQKAQILKDPPVKGSEEVYKLAVDSFDYLVNSKVVVPVLAIKIRLLLDSKKSPLRRALFGYSNPNTPENKEIIKKFINFLEEQTNTLPEVLYSKRELQYLIDDLKKI